MASGNTIFITYVLIPTGNTIGSGFTQSIHCNYIKKLQATASNPYITEVNLNFPDINDFKFLSDDIASGSGYTMNCIHAVVQIVDNTPFDTVDDVIPTSSAWKYMNITDQINLTLMGVSGELTASGLTSQVFKVSLYDYTGTTFSGYTLNYLNYPASTQIDELCFGDVTYFFGNVTSEIKSEVYTTDLSISLVEGEFNTSTNLTWDSEVDSKVYISEIGIYDSNKNLVAIGKMNDPVAKDDSINRTIVFALDF